MLSDTLADIGGSGYVMGNFVVHYWPWLRLYFQRSVFTDAYADTHRVREYVHQAAYAATFPFAYLASTRAGTVYGCNMTETTLSIASGIVGIIVVATWQILRH